VTTKGVRWTIFGVLITALLLAPVYLMIMYSFETLEDMFHIPPYLFPPNPTLKPMIETFTGLRANLWNSIVYSVGTLIITLIVAPPAAYALAHFNLRINKYVNMTLFLSQMFPVVMLAIPLFLIYSRLDLVNTRIGMILANTTYSIPFCTLVLTAFMKSVPFDLVEAALIDGASSFGAFFRVALPIAKSGLATCAIFAFLFPWSDFVYGMIISVDNKMQPMSVGLYKYMELYGLRWNNLMAGGLIFAIPALVIVVLAGRFIVQGLTAGAIKG
jgi:multiple sugar transport system permease protein